jgi:hypothetical protein
MQDVTKSVDSLRTTLSITGVKIPRYDSFSDVFEFLGEYELLTTGLDDKQRILMLAKAFPVKCHRAYYEAELAPLISNPKPWSEVKKLIIKRFADTDDQARHLLRLRELKFDPEEDKSLLDFAEEVFHSYKRAYPPEVVKSTAVAHVKASLPKSLRQALNMHSDFREASDEEALKRALKHYDLAKNVNKKAANSRELTREVTDMLKETLKGFQDQMIESQKAVVAAIKMQDEKLERVSRNRYQSPERGRRDQRPQSPRNSSNQYGRSSPARDRRYYNSPGRGESSQAYRESQSNNYYDRRPPSKDRNDSYNSGYRSVSDRPPTPHAKDENRNSSQNAQEIFDTKRYLDEFKMPPRPCSYCGSNHWDRHCPFNLKA